MNTKAYLLSITVLLLACMLFSGCEDARSIREDAVQENLPVIDPGAGIERDLHMSLYYRLSGEPYLVPISAQVSVRIDETPEEAIVRALFGTNHIQAEASAAVAFSDETEVIEVVKDNNILYITLSEAFLSNGKLQQAQQEAESQLAEESITKEEYDLRMEKLQQEIFIDRRMGLYSVVNSITAYDQNLRVLLSVERQGGESERIGYEELGIENDGASDLLEPLSFEESVVATPASILECVLRHLAAGETEAAYFWIAEEAGKKPELDAFTELVQNADRITGYEIAGYSFGNNVNYAYAEADITTARASDGAETTRRKRIRMQKEGDTFRVGYDSFVSALGGAA